MLSELRKINFFAKKFLQKIPFKNNKLQIFLHLCDTSSSYVKSALKNG